MLNIKIQIIVKLVNLMKILLEINEKKEPSILGFFNNETKLKRSINLVDNSINNFSEFNNSIINERIKRKIAVDKRLKWGLTIFYHTEEPLNPFMIAGALKTIEKETCLRFISLKNRIPNVSGIYYKYVGECLSLVGRQNKKEWQLIKIGKPCDFPGGVIHETFHALGLTHEQCRPDRDFYLKIIEKNSRDSYKWNCQKVNPSEFFNYFLPFDYGSIMHYGYYSNSKNGRRTLVPLYPHYEKTIGNLASPSFTDFKIINLHYCGKICSSKIYCFNDGYQDPNKCDTCKCVEGYGGHNCFSFAKPKRGCRKTKVVVDGKTINFRISGRKNCVYHLLSKRRKLIIVQINAMCMMPNYRRVCSFENALEVKYLGNKVTTGARFCLKLENIQIKSQYSHVIIYYKSTDPRNFVSLYFKELI
uniref:Metalloendopeptidase n=1 Tax=Strongyloides stercoralis TaxID=6248 RepID=A0A0K0EJL8_STRER